MRKRILQPHIAMPQDHGAWVFLLSPLAIGLFAGQHFNPASFLLIIAALAAFLARQPATVAVKVLAKRRPRPDLLPALIWLFFYGFVALAATAGLILLGHARILLLAIPGIPVFAWHLVLVGRRQERRQAGVEVIASGVLALAAPAAFWIGLGVQHPLGWALWLLSWLQSAASIVYAYLRLEQRSLPAIPSSSGLWQMGRRALLYGSFNLALALAGSLSGLLPGSIFLPFLLQWAETIWGITRPAIGLKPTQIGLRQLLVSTIFTILFIITWR